MSASPARFDALTPSVSPVIDIFKNQRGGRAAHPAQGKPSDEVLSGDALMVIAEGLAQSVPSSGHRWTGVAGSHYAPLLDTELYDAWLIVWSPDSMLDLHDHGESVGAVVVAVGRLVEGHGARWVDGPLRTRTLSAGGGCIVPTWPVQTISNPGPERALSVHIYSPPVRSTTLHVPQPKGLSRPAHKGQSHLALFKEAAT